MHGNSYALGNGQAMGASTHNGPGAAEYQQGWHIRVASIWDHLEPGMPTWPAS